MCKCLFASDLHGEPERYLKLFQAIAQDNPTAVFLGGDLLPSGLLLATTLGPEHRDFVRDFLATQFGQLRQSLASSYPKVFLILGNDDSRSEEAALRDVATAGIWEYIHERRVSLNDHDVYGYACVNPTPFLLKDWERYDVSRHVDPGCVPPEEGYRSVPITEHEARYVTIEQDLQRLTGDNDLARALILFHAPPYDTRLDRAALDGKTVQHAPLDVHIGSIAIRRFIEDRQPLVTLHGHVHESAGLTGSWVEKIGRTYCFSAAHDGPELALVRFDLDDPESASRDLL
ncbi:metallophosphoesterase [bacterium]|nr:metallophosphoesterase [bacterium]